MQKQKEPLSASTAKLVMVVSLIVCLGALLGAVGYITMKQKYKPLISESIEKRTLETELFVFDNKDFDIFKFIPEDSIVLQKSIDDIDNDRKKEIILYYLSEPSLYPGNKKTGKLKFMILKMGDKNDYDISWEYD